MSRSVRAKTRSAILYVLKNGGDMEIMRLAKLIYLADYTYAKVFGNKHGFIDQNQRYPYGPVPSNFYKEYNSLLREGIIDRGEDSPIVTLEHNTYDSYELVENETACLDKVIDDFKGKSLDNVKNTAYKTEPMLEILQEEERIGHKLDYDNLSFKKINTHPLLKPIEVDLSFLKTVEFKKNLN